VQLFHKTVLLTHFLTANYLSWKICSVTSTTEATTTTCSWNRLN